jgi:iron(III) transport system permease protein
MGAGSSQITRPAPAKASGGGMGAPEKRRAKVSVIDWLRENVFSVAIVAMLLWLIAAPLSLVINMSFRQGSPANPGEFTLEHYSAVYGDSLTYTTLGNTVVYAAAVTAISLGLAAACAWLIERTDMPGRNFAWVAMLIPMAMPGLLSAMAWILLASPQIGVLNVAVRSVLGLFGVELESGPFNIYSLAGMIWVEGIKGTSTLFLMIVGAFRLMDPALEGAATMSGATKLQTLRRVTLPLMLPAILAAAIYAFLGNLEDFDTPLLLGLPANVFILPTLIYFKAYVSPASSWGIASAYTSIFLVLMFALIVFYYRVVVTRSRRFATVSGKGFRPQKIKLGIWRWPAFGVILAFFTFSMLLPLAILVYSSLVPVYVGWSMDSVRSFSFANYVEVFNDPKIARATINTLIIGISTATVTMVLALGVSWAVIRGRTRGRSAMDAMAFAPNAIPAVALGFGMVIFYLNPALRWLSIYGTLTIIVIALATKYLAYTTRLGNSALLQISSELEEAALVSGAGRFRAFARVTFPLVLPTLLAGWIWVAAHAFRNLTFPLLLATPGTETIALRMYVYWERFADFPLTSAMGVLLIGVLLLFALLSRRLIVEGIGR